MVTDHLVRSDDVSPLYDHGAERMVLGAMMLNDKIVAEVEGILTSSSFHYPPHRLVFEALIHLRANNKPTSPEAVAGHLHELGKLQLIPKGAVYLVDLIQQVPIPDQGLFYAQQVKRKAVSRILYEGLHHAIKMITSDGAPPEAVIEKINDLTSLATSQTAVDGGPVLWRDLIQPGFDAIEQAAESAGKDTLVDAIPTGVIDLDRLINGLQRQRLYIVAGVPGAGKSTLGAGDFVRSAAFRHNKPTLVFSMEMTRLEIFNRLLCAEAQVESQKLITGALQEQDWSRLAKKAGETSEAPLWIDDSKGITMADIRMRARRWKQQHDIQLVVIDYLGLIDCRDSLAPRNQQVDSIARQAKLLAGELDIPVVLLCQLNRNYAHRTDKRPRLTDLRESGGIEAHADVVIFVHREDVVEQDSEHSRSGEADLIVAKNRGGPIGTVTVAAQMHFNRFVSITIDVPPVDVSV